MERVKCAIWRRGADIVREMHNSRSVCLSSDRTRTISYITESGIVRGRSWTRQIVSDAWESMIADAKLAAEDQPRILVKEPLEVECQKNSTSGL